MDVLLEIVIQFFGEVVLQLVFEALAELGLHIVREPFKRSQPLHPWLACLGYGIFGAISGALSLWLVPSLFITSREGRLVNLFVAPVIAGTAMAGLGALRRSRGQPLVRLDSFVYGFVFALALALMRFAYGH